MTWFESSAVVLSLCSFFLSSKSSLDVGDLEQDQGNFEHGKGSLEHEQGNLEHG